MIETAPSPLPLFVRNAALDDPSANEVVILTFTHDLGYFERAALGVVQTTGARITVVADANVARYDLYSIRRAGSAYLPGLAVARGAFHPKVIVIAGEERATVAIGSGNLTLPGWHGNDELWSVHHADRDSGSPVVAELAPWLQALPDHVRLSDGVGAALARTAGRLEKLATSSDDVRLVHSLNRPIIEQLPADPVDRLAVYAPFHDEGARALRAIIDRLAPAEVSVALQPNLTRLDGPAVAAALGGLGRVVSLSDSPNRHGKLIEWERDGTRWALTGSPNVSTSALLRSVADGGNVEIGVVGRVAASLMPEGKPARGDLLGGLEFKRTPETERSSVIILSATQTDNGVRVQLAGPLAMPAALHVSPYSDGPHSWRVAASLVAGDIETTVAETLQAGSRVRLELADGSRSNPAFVIVPAQVLKLRRTAPIGRQTPEIDSIFTDVVAAERLFRILDDLRRSPNTPRRLPTSGGTGRLSGEGRATEIDSWQEYLDRCQGRLAPSILGFALGLPLIGTGGAATSADVDWDEEGEIGDAFGGLEEDAPELVDEHNAVDTRVAPSLRRATEVARRRYRRVAKRMCREWRDADIAEQLLALRFALELAAAGAWALDDDDWMDVVLDGVDQLSVEGRPPEVETRAGSLAALALSVVEGNLRGFERTVRHLRFDRSTGSCSHLLVAADERVVAEFATGLEVRFPASAKPSAVMALRDQLVNDNPIEDALMAVNRVEHIATASGRIIDVSKHVNDPRSLAYQVLAQAEDASPVAIRVRGSSSWATVLWDSPDLVVIWPGASPADLLCDVHRYPRNERPSTDIRTEHKPRRTIQQTMAGQPLPPLAFDLLAKFGLDGPGPLSE